MFHFRDPEVPSHLFHLPEAALIMTSIIRDQLCLLLNFLGDDTIQQILSSLLAFPFLTLNRNLLAKETEVQSNSSGLQVKGFLGVSR